MLQRWIGLIGIVAAGCAPAAEYPSTPSSSFGSSSGYSASLGSSTHSGAGISVPARGAAQGDLVVRPDVILLGFALKETDTDPQKALAAAQAATGEVTQRLQKATGGAAAVRMCGTSVSPAPASAAYSKGDDKEAKAPRFAVVVDGSIEVRLGAELDYWARSRIVAAIAQATRELADATKDVKDGSRGARFDELRPAVKDAEPHRAKLVARWVTRARAFADAAETEAAQLHLIECTPPGEIEQKVISLEEIGLSLAVSCRVDALRTGK